MIDWITASLPYSGPVLRAGEVVSIGADGRVEWSIAKSVIPEGSHGQKLTFRTMETGRLHVTGNPSKFVQAHNLFGSDALVDLLVAAVVRGFEILGLQVPPADLAAWIYGDFTLSRVDVTYMFDVGSTADVRAWLRAASEASRVKWKNKHFDSGTLYFGRASKGKRAKDESWKLYCKADEIDAHPLPALPYREELLQYAEGKLRAELTLRTRALKKLGLQIGSQWNGQAAADVFGARWETLEMGDNATVPVEVVQGLPSHLHKAYLAWHAGMDPRELYQRRSAFRYRKAILQQVGVDIFIAPVKSNVVPLRRVLTLRPVGSPAWARGTPALFEGRAA